MDKRRLIAEALRRVAQRKLFLEYGTPFDHSRPFGKDNIGPYNWQVEFHNAGATYPERMMMAANRVGKTRSGAAETAMHLTGWYPDWWQGRRFDEPVDWWCGSETNEASRDIVQMALVGPVGQFGTGWIPAEALIGEPTKRQAGIGNVVDTILVRHKTGGISQCTLKTYEQGEKVWQGTSKHGIWLDEEPPMKIFTEALTRLLDKRGIMIVTRTPLAGVSEVVRHFTDAQEGSGIYVKSASWDDAPHLDEESKKRLAASYPDWERETRTRGVPLTGTGLVFPIEEDRIVCDPFELPRWYRRINGIDFGIDHPGAGVFLAIDPESGTVYLYDCYKARNETALYHATAMRKHGDWIPNAWPHDGHDRDKGSGEAIKNQFRQHGCYMLKEHAQYPDERGNNVNPGLDEMFEYMKTGRFKVFKTCRQWLEERRMYCREDGKVVRKFDDVISASRYAFVMRRYARPKPSDTPIGSNSPIQPIAGRRRWDTG